MAVKEKQPDQAARLRKRNQLIREKFDHLNKVEPNWRLKEYLNELSEKFFLSPDTIYSIVRGYYPEPKTD